MKFRKDNSAGASAPEQPPAYHAQSSPAGTPGPVQAPLRPSRGRRLGGWVAVLSSLAALASLFAASPASAAGPPAWKLTISPSADYFLPGSDEGAWYTIEAENVGGESTSGSITIEDVLPANLTGQRVAFYQSGLGFSEFNDLAESGDCPTALQCEYPASSPSVHPGQKLVMAIEVEALAAGSIEAVAAISGGGALPAQATAGSEVDPDPPFGLHSFSAALTDSSKSNPYTQAGGHPYQITTQLDFSTENGAGSPVGGSADPVRDPKDAGVDLPPGLIGNPQALPTCSLANFFNTQCPLKTVVGDVGIRLFGQAQGGLRIVGPLFNLAPSGGAYPGELGFTAAAIPFLLVAGVRSGSDYGLTITSLGSAAVSVNRFRATVWGVPADPSHNAMRGKSCLGGIQWSREFAQSVEQNEQECVEDPAGGPGGPAGVPPTAFLTMPTQCSGQPLSFGGHSNSWQLPGEYAEARDTSPAVDGCEDLRFEPQITARPTTALADAPSGFEFDLHVPQSGIDEPTGLAQADLSEAVVRLPAGLVVNPSSGSGLQGCSPAQIGLSTPVGQTPAHFTEEPAQCPDASKLGLVEVKTPLLHEPLGAIEPLPGRVGAVYLATPHQNPSGGLLAGYIVLEGQGLIIKLAGQFQTNPQTGQITASFLENPQVPFEDFKFKFFEGARGALRTPAVCGTYEVGSTLTPYSAPESGPPAEPTSEFETTEGPQGEGSSCPNASSEEPNKPTFTAGTESPQAGIYSPFSLKLVRQDGEQEIKAIETTLPPGLVGKLAGVGECSEAQLAVASSKSGTAEQASPSCPANTEVGTVDVAAGAGPTPLNVSGKAYLAGPYKGAPLSLAIITPAVAGPFDLGTVVVRTALYVNPETAQITAKSDPIPTILEGIPLDVRSITLKMARPNFTLNPTDCEPLSFSGSALSVLNVSAPLTQRFQVGGCPALKFKPKLKLSLKGSTKRTGHPALKAVLTMKPGEANIAKAQVTLPHSAFLAQNHIKTICTRVQFGEGTVPGEKCPAGSIYGFAKATTPLLDNPVQGPVYLRSSSHNLPDLVAALNGQINVDLDGTIDTGKGNGIRNTFEVVPDAPVSKFTLEMAGGKKGLIETSENLCSPKAKTKAIADFTGQNGKTYDTTPAVANSCKKKGGKGKKHGKGHKHHKSASHRVGTSHR